MPPAKTGWLAASGKSGDDAVTALAGELAPPLGAAIPSDRAHQILGRDPNAEEALLIREIGRVGTVKRGPRDALGGPPVGIGRALQPARVPEPVAR